MANGWPGVFQAYCRICRAARSIGGMVPFGKVNQLIPLNLLEPTSIFLGQTLCGKQRGNQSLFTFCSHWALVQSSKGVQSDHGMDIFSCSAVAGHNY